VCVCVRLMELAQFPVRWGLSGGESSGSVRQSRSKLITCYLCV